MPLLNSAAEPARYAVAEDVAMERWVSARRGGDTVFTNSIVAALAAGARKDFDPEKVAVKRTAMAAARGAVLLCHGEKFGRSALHRIAPARDFRAIICDLEPPLPLAAALRGAGVAIRVT